MQVAKAGYRLAAWLDLITESIQAQGGGMDLATEGGLEEQGDASQEL